MGFYLIKFVKLTAFLGSLSETFEVNVESATRTYLVKKINDSSQREHADTLVTEEPLSIAIAHEDRTINIAVTMRTPGHDADLALGFVVAEGLLHAADGAPDYTAIQTITAPDDNTVILHVNESAFVRMADADQLRRYSFVQASCGVCGSSSISDLRAKGFRRIEDTTIFMANQIRELPDRLRREQTIFEQTGGLHGAGLFDQQGHLLCAREDIGRHNAVDKIMGWAFSQRRLPLEGHLLLVSGRVSYEIVQKALSVGIPCIAAVSAPSSLAVKTAHEFGMTLIGFLRYSQYNIYTGAQRVKL